MEEASHTVDEIHEKAFPQRLKSVSSFDKARDAVKKGDIAYISRYLAAAAAQVQSEVGGYTLLHYAAMSGQVEAISELLAAGFDPYAYSSTGETALELAERNGHHGAQSLLQCHTYPPPSPPSPTEYYDEDGPAESKSRANEDPCRKPGRLAFGKQIWRGGETLPDEGSSETPIMKNIRTPKKGRGKRPGSSPSVAPVNIFVETPKAAQDGQCTSWLNDALRERWVLHTNPDGYRFYWNEALQESRWVDNDGSLPVILPELSSPYSIATPLGSIAEGLPSPACLNGEDKQCDTSYATWARGIVSESPVHSPGWPYPRGTQGGVMHILTSTKKRGGTPSPLMHTAVSTPAPNDSFAMSPTPLSPPPPLFTPRDDWIAELASSHDTEDLPREIERLKMETTASVQASKPRTGFNAKNTCCNSCDDGDGDNDASTLVDTLKDGLVGVGICSSRSSESSADNMLDYNNDIDADCLDSVSTWSSSSSPTFTDESHGHASEGTVDLVKESAGDILAAPLHNRFFPRRSASLRANAMITRPVIDGGSALLVEHQERPNAADTTAVDQMSAPGVPSMDDPIRHRSDSWVDVARLAPYAPAALWCQEAPESGTVNIKASSITPEGLQRQCQQQQSATENFV